MADDIRALLVRITGQVQGVGFRDWTQKQARQLGLTGWVRNEADGAVAALIVGPDAAVAAMMERFWKGPRFSSVTAVKAETTEVAEVPGDFRITR